MWRGEDRFRNLSHEILSLLPVPNNNQELAHQQGKETGQIHSTSPSQFWDQWHLNEERWDTKSSWPFAYGREQYVLILNDFFRIHSLPYHCKWRGAAN